MTALRPMAKALVLRARATPDPTSRYLRQGGPIFNRPAIPNTNNRMSAIAQRL